MNYCLYYPDCGVYSVPMTLKAARELKDEMYEAYIVNIKTAEVVD